MDGDVLAGYTYCISSKRRNDIVCVLGGEGCLTPTQIAKQTSIHTNHVSTLLRDLKEHHIVHCLNEEKRKGKLYGLTPLGSDLYPYLIGERKFRD